MSRLNHRYSSDSNLNDLFEELAERLFLTKLTNLNLFVLNFIVKNADRISELDLSSFEISNLNLKFDTNALSADERMKLVKAATFLQDKLKEIKKDSDLVEITILPEKEPSMEEIHRGLMYSGNNDTSYDFIPNTFTIGNY